MPVQYSKVLWSNILFSGFACSWEAFFGSAMDAGDDVSDSASMYSVDRSVRSVRQRGGGGAMGVPRAAVAASVAGSVAKKSADHKPVSTLKPKVRLTGHPQLKQPHAISK